MQIKRKLIVFLQSLRTSYGQFNLTKERTFKLPITSIRIIDVIGNLNVRKWLTYSRAKYTCFICLRYLQ